MSAFNDHMDELREQETMELINGMGRQLNERLELIEQLYNGICGTVNVNAIMRGPLTDALGNAEAMLMKAKPDWQPNVNSLPSLLQQTVIPYTVAQPSPCMVNGCTNTIPVWRMSSVCEDCETASLTMAEQPSTAEQARANEQLAPKENHHEPA